MNGLFQTPLVGRADLLRLLSFKDPAMLSAGADLLGFEPSIPVDEVEVPEQEHIHEPIQQTVPKEDPKPQEILPEVSEPLGFTRVVSFRPLEKESVEIPEWMVTGEVFKPGDDLGDEKAEIPKHKELIPWSRLWPFLKATMSRKKRSGMPDMRRIVKTFSIGKPLRKIPVLKRNQWAPQGQLVLDKHERNRSFRTDFDHLQQKFLKMRGVSGLDTLEIEDGPFGDWQRPSVKGRTAYLKSHPKPESGTPMLFLSDMGCFNENPYFIRVWEEFGEKLKKRGYSPLALTVAPPRLWTARLRKNWQLFYWGRGARLPRQSRGGAMAQVPQIMAINEDEGRQITEKIIASLYGALRVEPDLLRHLCYSLSSDMVDNSVEAAVWNHQDFDNLLGWVIPKSDHHGKYKKIYDTLDPRWRKRSFEKISDFHKSLPRSLQIEEKIQFSLMEGQGLSEEVKDYLATFFRSLERSEATLKSSLVAFFERLAERKWCTKIWENPQATALLVKILGDRIKNGELELPSSVNEEMLRLMNGKETGLLVFLFEEAEGLVIRYLDLWPVSSDRLGPTLVVRSGPYGFQVIDREGNCRTVPPVKGFHLDTGPRCDWRIQDQVGEYRLVKEPPPDWCCGMGRDVFGLNAFIKEKGAKRKIFWSNPVQNLGLFNVKDGVSYGYWNSESNFGPTLQMELISQWAVDQGQDNYGMWADFEVQGIRQRLRWILPGEFLMGSPITEAERSDDEKQHQVIITKGFWLADTTVTQELWQAVMGKNPSRFKGKGRPVEQVSWEDCQAFINKLNQLVPRLDIRLPSEAEWEYACRAGTQTPFSFGENITPEQVNYNGNYPYKDGQKGIYREETVPVKDLPANPWGLHQMHGNVWECCQDFYWEYPKGSVIDPTGSDEVARRVIRGGSWGFNGRFCRSAYRSLRPPDVRYRILGLRLARGQTSQQEGS